MPQQPDLISPPMPASPAPDPGAPSPVASSAQPAHHERIPLWLVRSELFLRVLLRIYIGIFVFCAPWSSILVFYVPWSTMFWDQNPLFVQFPTLSIYAANGAVRGIISGLGLLNIWIALRDAMHYKDK